MPPAEGRKFTTRWIVEVLAATAPIPAAFIYFNQFGRGRIAWIGVIALVCAVRSRWELRCRSWFWTTVALIVVAEAPAVIFIPWTTDWIPAVVLAPLAIADALVIFYIFRFVEKWMARPGQDASSAR